MSENREPENNGNPWVKSLLVWGGIFLALLLVVSMFGGPRAAAGTQMGYSDFRQKVAEGSVDAVQISTPPFFHVEHLDGIVSAKKHAYCEKPVGVDIPQTRRALEIGKKHDGKVSMAVGFQIRSAPPVSRALGATA